MTVHKLLLAWKRDVDGVREDVELGTCFQATRPLVGELISFASDNAPDQTGVWRVVLVYHQPFMHGSVTWRRWSERGEEPEDLTYYWVEPAEGPWEP